MTDVFDDSNTDSIQAGREGDPFVQTPEWILVSGISPQAQALYTALRAHVNHSRKDRLVWPGMELLAELLGFKTRRSITKYVAELKALGAVDVERQRGTTHRKNIYTVHKTPPEGYTGMRSLSEFHAAWKAKRPLKPPMGIQVPVAAGTQVPLPTGTTVAHNHTNQTTRTYPDEVTSSDEVPSIGQLSRSKPQRKIIIKPRFWHLKDGPATQYLVAAALSSITAAGMIPHAQAGDFIGKELKRCREEEKETRAQLVYHVQSWVNLAGTNDSLGPLGRWPKAAAA